MESPSHTQRAEGNFSALGCFATQEQSLWKGMRSMRRINNRLLFLALPFILGFLMFYLIPMIGSVRYSFMKSAFDHTFAGISNYLETLNNEYFRLSLKNTLEMILIGVPALMATALLLALFIQSLGKSTPALLQAALILPMLVPSAAVAHVFGKLPVEGPRVPLLAVYVWKNAGFLMLIYLSAFSMIPRAVYEASALDGAGKARMFFSITLPMISGALLFSMILAISYNLRLFREAYLMYGAYPDPSVYLTQHYINNHFYKLNYQKLTSAAVLFLAVLLAPMGAGAKALKGLSEGRRR